MSTYYCSYCIYLKHNLKGNASSFKTGTVLHIQYKLRDKNISQLETQMLGTVKKTTNVYEILSTNVHGLFREISV